MEIDYALSAGEGSQSYLCIVLFCKHYGDSHCVWETNIAYTLDNQKPSGWWQHT